MQGTYADNHPSMAAAIDETNHKRVKQVAYNTERGLDPNPAQKTPTSPSTSRTYTTADRRATADQTASARVESRLAVPNSGSPG